MPKRLTEGVKTVKVGASCVRSAFQSIPLTSTQAKKNETVFGKRVGSFAHVFYQLLSSPQQSIGILENNATATGNYGMTQTPGRRKLSLLHVPLFISSVVVSTPTFLLLDATKHGLQSVVSLSVHKLS